MKHKNFGNYILDGAKKGGERFAALMEHTMNMVTFRDMKVVRRAA